MKGVRERKNASFVLSGPSGDANGMPQLQTGTSFTSTANTRARQSLNQVSSLVPNLEFEVIKLVLLRESYLQRLKRKLNDMVVNGTTLTIAVVGLFDVLRDSSIEVVETIVEWERTQVNYPLVKPFLWNGVNYLDKMVDDLSFVNDFPQIPEWLGFRLVCNPFIVPPDVLLPNVSLDGNAYVVFGQRPYFKTEVVIAKEKKKKLIQSPYNVPIINDSKLIQSTERIKTRWQLKTEEEAKLRRAKVKSATPIANEDKSLDDPADPFELYVPAATIMKVRRCWAVLCKVSPLLSTTTGQFLGSALLATHDMGPSMQQTGEGLGVGYTKGEGGNNGLELCLGEGAFSMVDDGRNNNNNNINHHFPSDTGFGNQNMSMTSQSMEDGGNLLMASMEDGKGHTSLFTQTSEAFRHSTQEFRDSIISTANPPSPAFTNKSMRLSALKFEDGVDGGGSNQPTSAAATSMSMGTTSIMSSLLDSQSKRSKVWTPHEVTLQQVVQKKGGELHVLTAAATRGRIKAPRRRTRFQRMESDLHHIEDQLKTLTNALAEIEEKKTLSDKNLRYLTNNCERSDSSRNDEDRSGDTVVYDKATIQEIKNEVEVQRDFLQYQYDQFKKMTVGGFEKLETHRKMHALKDGEVLEVDEKLSMSIEDSMAKKIQLAVKRRFGRAIRKMHIRRRHKAAIKIQGLFLKVHHGLLAIKRIRQITLAMNVQRLWRGTRGFEQVERLKWEARKFQACKLIQRVYRGFRGYRYVKLKREFIESVRESNKCVSLVNITARDVDDLCEMIEFFEKDFSIELPTALLSLLRCVLYCLNGDEPQTIILENSGYKEVKQIYAKNATWNGVKLVMRRKGKFLRRLRCLAAGVAHPHPLRYAFTEGCVQSLDSFYSTYQESDVTCFPRGKIASAVLYKFLKCIQKIYHMQHLFNDYFDVTLPKWFRDVMKLQEAAEWALIQEKIYKKACNRLEFLRNLTYSIGKKGKYVSMAQNEVTKKATEATQSKITTRDLVRKFISKDRKNFVEKMTFLEELKRHRELSVQVFQRDLDEYLRQTFAPDEERIKEFHRVIDVKTLDLLETVAQIINTKKQREYDETSMHFKVSMNMKEIHLKAKQLGVVEADLMVLNFEWKYFLIKIGGVQFVRDLVGEEKEYYEKSRQKATVLMKTRRDLLAFINAEFKNQISRAKSFALQVRIDSGNKHWDVATPIELSVEEEENHTCAKRDADMVEKALKTTNRVYIPPAKMIPAILLLDVRIPPIAKDAIIRKLLGMNFVLCKKHQADPDLHVEAQKLIYDGHNIILLVDRGTSLVARYHFRALFNALIASLAIDAIPRVVALDATLNLRIENWHTDIASDNASFMSFDVGDSCRCTLLVGRIRKRATLLKQGIVYKSIEEDRRNGCTVDLPQHLRSLFVEDMNNFIYEIGGLSGDNYDDLTHSSTIEHSGTVLAAVIAGILGWWKAPVLTWKENHLADGCYHFLEHFGSLEEEGCLERFCQALYLSPFPEFTMLQLQRLKPLRRLNRVMETLSSINFFDGPARGTLAMWCMEVIDLMETIAVQGGAADQSFVGCDVAASVDLKWMDDVCSKDVDKVLGKLLFECFKSSIVYECEDCNIVEYTTRKNIEDVEKEEVVEHHTRARCYVSYQGHNAFVGVQVNKEVDGEMKTVTFHQTMRMEDLVTMLQPNSTEIFEGRVKRYDISENGTHKWYEIFPTWTRLDYVEEKFQVRMQRIRILVLSKLTFVSGYRIRYEVFEELYGNLSILIHGALPDKGSLSFHVNPSFLNSFLPFANIYEKTNIETLDAFAVASIFTDRLELYPSKRWNEFLRHGELEPKDISRPVTPRPRFRKGPGRLVGHKALKINKTWLFLTVYEISNATDIHGLRIIVYDKRSEASVEWSISPLERVLLFRKDLPLYGQILKKLRIVYCDLMQPRKMMHLGDDFEPRLDDFDVDGEQEYEINFGAADDFDESFGDNDEMSDSISPRSFFGGSYEGGATTTSITSWAGEGGGAASKVSSTGASATVPGGGGSVVSKASKSSMKSKGNASTATRESASSTNSKKSLLEVSAEKTELDLANTFKYSMLSDPESSDEEINSQGDIYDLCDDVDRDLHGNVNNDDDPNNGAAGAAGVGGDGGDGGDVASVLSHHSRPSLASHAIPEDLASGRVSPFGGGVGDASYVGDKNSIGLSDKRPTITNYGWGMYFDRGVTEQLVGNLSISVNLCVADQSFGVTVLDKRSSYELYHRLPFESSQPFLESSVPIKQLLQTVNEGIVLGNVDEILRCIEIKPASIISPDEASSVVTSTVASEGTGTKATSQGKSAEFDVILKPVHQGHEAITIGSLKKFKPKANEKRRKIIKGGIPERRVDIRVFSASNLTRLGNVAQRNSYCSVKWNMRSAGKSEVAIMTTEPEWNNADFTMRTRKGQPIEKCVLEVEVFDSDSEVKKGDFLGSILITGKELIDFLKEEQKTLFPLNRCNRLPDHEQRFVQGSILICGQIDAKKPGYYKYEEEERKARSLSRGMSSSFNLTGRKKKEKKGGFLSSGWGWGSKSKGAEVKEDELQEEEGEEGEELLEGEEGGEGNLVGEGVDPDQPPAEADVNENPEVPILVEDKIEEEKEVLREYDISELDPLPTRLAGRRELILTFLAAEANAKRDHVLVIKLNGYTSGKTLLSTNETLVTTFEESRFSVFIPPTLEVGACCLDVEIWDWKMKDLQGCLSIRGNDFESLANSKDNAGTWFEVNSSSSLIAANGDVNRSSVDRLQLRLAYDELSQERTLTLDVVSAAGLVKAGIMSSIAPFVNVYLNNVLIATTKEENSVNPTWSQRFDIPFPSGKLVNHCRLEFEVLDKARFLGCVVFKGQDLVNLIKDSEGGNVSTRTLMGNLQKYPDKAAQASVKGSLSVKALIRVTENVVDAQEKNVQDAVIDPTSETNSPSKDLPCQSTSLWAQNQDVRLFHLTINSAADLLDKDENKPDDFLPYVKLIFNGLEVAKTEIGEGSIKNSSAQWPDTQSSFAIPIPRGLPLSACRLQLRVLNKYVPTNKKRAVEDSVIDEFVYGFKEIYGQELLGLLPQLVEEDVQVDEDNDMNGDEVEGVEGGEEGDQTRVDKRTEAGDATSDVERTMESNIDNARFESISGGGGSSGVVGQQGVEGVEGVEGEGKDSTKAFDTNEEGVERQGEINSNELVPNPTTVILTRESGRPQGNLTFTAFMTKEHMQLNAELEPLDVLADTGLLLKGIDVELLKAIQLKKDVPSGIENIKAIIRWNGQVVGGLQPSSLKLSPSPELHFASPPVRLFVPLRFKLSACHLDINVMDIEKNVSLGSLQLTRESLIALMTEAPVTQSSNIFPLPPSAASTFDLISPMSTTADVKEADALGKPEVLGKMELALQLVQLSPSSSTGDSNVGGEVIGGVPSDFPVHPNTSYFYIQTALSAENEAPTGDGGGRPGSKSASAAGRGSGSGSGGGGDPETMNATKDPETWTYTFEDWSTIVETKDPTQIYREVGFGLPTNQLGERGNKKYQEGILKSTSVSLEDAQSVHSAAALHRIVTSTPNKMSSRTHIEEPFITYFSQSEDRGGGVLDEDRVCWRGRVLPKNFMGEDGISLDSLFTSRASRIVKGKRLQELEQLADVSYLKEFGDDAQKPLDELPIRVKEIMTDGPEVCTRTYRIEVLSNDGSRIGSVDIFDEEDLKLVCGAKFCADNLDNVPRSEWRMEQVFEHIVMNRLVLDLKQRKKASKSTAASLMGALSSKASKEAEEAKSKEEEKKAILTFVYLLRGEGGVTTVPDKKSPSTSRASTPSTPMSGFGMGLMSNMNPSSRATTPSGSRPTSRSTFRSMISQGLQLVGLQKEEEEVQVVEEQAPFVEVKRLQWCRVYAMTHKLSGMPMRSLITLQGYDPTLYNRPLHYFNTAPAEVLLQELTLCIKSTDGNTHRTFSLSMPGTELLSWLQTYHPLFQLDLRTKYRRGLLGQFILKNLSATYTDEGDVTLALIIPEIIETPALQLAEGGTESLVDDGTVSALNNDSIDGADIGDIGNYADVDVDADADANANASATGFDSYDSNNHVENNMEGLVSIAEGTVQ